MKAVNKDITVRKGSKGEGIGRVAAKNEKDEVDEKGKREAEGEC